MWMGCFPFQFDPNISDPGRIAVQTPKCGTVIERLSCKGHSFIRATKISKNVLIPSNSLGLLHVTSNGPWAIPNLAVKIRKSSLIILYFILESC